MHSQASGRGAGVTVPSRSIHHKQDGEQDDMAMRTRADGTHADAQEDKGDETGSTPLTERRLAPGTRYTYERALLGLDRWLAGRPLTDESLSDYLGALFDRGLAAASATIAVAAVKDRAKREGEASPAGKRTASACPRTRRDAAGRGPGQVRGISWQESDCMADLAEASGSVRGTRDALLIRLMSDGMLRVSEAEALNVEDIAIGKRRLLVTVRHSKTDQEGRGTVFYGGPDTARLAREGGHRRGAAVPSG